MYQDIIVQKIYINNKQVITKENSTELLKKLWSNLKYGNVDIDKFYNYIKTKFWGITKNTIKTFLNNLESYQLHKRVIRAKTVNSIIPKEPNSYYQIDLIDMSKFYMQNRGYKWIFTILDLFTKRVYAFALKNKEEAIIAE